MQSLSPHPSAAKESPPDLGLEVERLDALLGERRAELTALQAELRDFKVRYAHVVGSRLAELAEVEREIREAETRALGLEPEDEEDEAERAAHFYAPSTAASGGVGLKRLFWSVARLFHPDHAADEQEAKRRHSIMAEASRAYRDGDVDSLHTLLGDEQLQSFCATAAHDGDDGEDLATRLLNLKEELRTIEFGIKRTRQDGLYQLMLKTRAEADEGRDALAAMAQSLARQIVKARRRLEHFP